MHDMIVDNRTIANGKWREAGNGGRELQLPIAGVGATFRSRWAVDFPLGCRESRSGDRSYRKMRRTAILSVSLSPTVAATGGLTR